MVRRTEGIFISCDEPIKQLLKHLNQTHQFIIKDLAEGQLFIKQESIKFVRDEIEKYLDQQTYRKPDN